MIAPSAPPIGSAWRGAGPPHLLLAHHPDDFYEAERRGVALVLSGHTHGGQIRFPAGPPIIRQSRFCLDEGLYVHGSAMLAVTRGLGAVGLPWRWGADPEAVLLRIRARHRVEQGRSRGEVRLATARRRPFRVPDAPSPPSHCGTANSP